MKKKQIEKLKNGEIALDLDSAPVKLLNEICKYKLDYDLYGVVVKGNALLRRGDFLNINPKSEIDDGGFVKGTAIRYVPYKDFLTRKEKLQLVYDGKAAISFPDGKNRERDYERLLSTIPKYCRIFNKTSDVGNFFWCYKYANNNNYLSLSTKQPDNLITLSTDDIISKQRRNFEAVRWGEKWLELPSTLKGLKSAKDIVYDIFPQAKGDLEGFFNDKYYLGLNIVADDIDFKIKIVVRDVPTVTVFDVVEKRYQDDAFKELYGDKTLTLLDEVKGYSWKPKKDISEAVNEITPIIISTDCNTKISDKTKFAIIERLEGNVVVIEEFENEADLAKAKFEILFSKASEENENLKKQLAYYKQVYDDVRTKIKNLNKSWAAQSNEIGTLKQRITNQAKSLKDYGRTIETNSKESEDKRLEIERLKNLLGDMMSQTSKDAKSISLLNNRYSELLIKYENRLVEIEKLKNSEISLDL